MKPPLDTNWPLRYLLNLRIAYVPVAIATMVGIGADTSFMRVMLVLNSIFWVAAVALLQFDIAAARRKLARKADGSNPHAKEDAMKGP